MEEVSTGPEVMITIEWTVFSVFGGALSRCIDMQ